MAKILIAAVLGAIVVFAWDYVFHDVLDLGMSMVKSMPAEKTVTKALQDSVKEPGVYVFPGGFEEMAKMTDEQKQQWQDQLAKGPTGFVVFNPSGDPVTGWKQLAVEFVSDVLAAFLAAWVLLRSRSGYLGRVLTVTAMGLFTWLVLDVSNWAWWGFPWHYIRNEGIDTVVGWFAAGILLAALARPEGTPET